MPCSPVPVVVSVWPWRIVWPAKAPIYCWWAVAWSPCKRSSSAIRNRFSLPRPISALRAGRDALVAAAQNFGGLNCLINAAGVNRFGLLDQQDEQQIAELIGLNVTATLQLTQRLLPLLRAQRRALVINVGSTFGAIGYPGFAAYCASKFAVRGFSEALRRELADTHVRVLYFAPRATRTAMNAPSVVAMNDELGVAMDDPAQVAEQLLDAIGREQEERHLGWPERLFVRLNGLLPRVVDQALRKQLPIIQRFARHKH